MTVSSGLGVVTALVTVTVSDGDGSVRDGVLACAVAEMVLAMLTVLVLMVWQQRCWLCLRVLLTVMLEM